MAVGKAMQALHGSSQNIWASESARARSTGSYTQALDYLSGIAERDLMSSLWESVVQLARGLGTTVVAEFIGDLETRGT